MKTTKRGIEPGVARRPGMLRYKVRKTLLCVIAGSLIGGAAYAQAIVPKSIDRHSSKVLQVSYVHGSVTVRRNSVPVRLREGFLVFSGEQVAVGDGSRTDMLLSRYGEMVLFPIETGGAFLTFEALPFSDWQVQRDTRVRLDSGELRLIWNSPNSGDGWPLEVAIGSWVAQAGDGHFLFRNGSRGSQVCALDGEMTMTNLRGQRYALHEGECLNNAVGYGPEMVVIESGHWDRLGVVRGVPLSNPLAAPAAGGLKVDARLKAPRVIEDAHSGGPLAVPSPLVSPAEGAPVALTEPLAETDLQVAEPIAAPSDFETFQVSPAPTSEAAPQGARLEPVVEAQVPAEPEVEFDRNVRSSEETRIPTDAVEPEIPALTEEEQTVVESSLKLAAPPSSTPLSEAELVAPAPPVAEPAQSMDSGPRNEPPEIVIQTPPVIAPEAIAPNVVETVEQAAPEVPSLPAPAVERPAEETIEFEALFDEPPAADAAPRSAPDSTELQEAIESERAVSAVNAQREETVASISADDSSDPALGESLKLGSPSKVDLGEISPEPTTKLPPIIAKAFSQPAGADAPDESAATTSAPSSVDPSLRGGGEGAWIVNVISSSDSADAQRHHDLLEGIGFEASLREDTVRGRTDYRVVIAGISDESTAVEIAQLLKVEHGYLTAWPLLKR